MAAVTALFAVEATAVKNVPTSVGIVPPAELFAPYIAMCFPFIARPVLRHYPETASRRECSAGPP